VSKFPRIINIGNMVLAAKDSQAGSQSMTIQATATTFVLVEPPPAPVETEAAKKATKKAPKTAPAKK
jgi:Tfp pilus assembly protein PilO